MDLILLEEKFAVCKLRDFLTLASIHEPFFLSVTRDEISLVCVQEEMPVNSLAAEINWRAFRVAGTLEFSLTGVIAAISSVLAKHGISLFVISTFDTDYILVKAENLERAASVLSKNGCKIKIREN